MIKYAILLPLVLGACVAQRNVVDVDGFDITVWDNTHVGPGQYYAVHTLGQNVNRGDIRQLDRHITAIEVFSGCAVDRDTLRHDINVTYATALC